MLDQPPTHPSIAQTTCVTCGDELPVGRRFRCPSCTEAAHRAIAAAGGRGPDRRAVGRGPRARDAVSGRPIGAVVGIAPYDWRSDEPPPTDGDVVLSTGGTAYLILEARRTLRPGRLALRCLKLGPASAIPEGARVVTLAWARRDRRARR